MKEKVSLVGTRKQQEAAEVGFSRNNLQLSLGLKLEREEREAVKKNRTAEVT